MEDMKKSLIKDIEKRTELKIIEPENAKLLIKLIENADSNNEAMMIAQLGTMYRKTGLFYDVRLEKIGSDIKYLKKNDKLSFDNGGIHHKLIIGDNYEALQNLLVSYEEQIDIIYIDPPYACNKMGEHAETNYENNITRDNLLSMLYPRLQLAKKLLTEEGVIFCSIDDKNYAYVKCLFDDVFDESSFVTTIHVELSTTQGMKVKAAKAGNIVKNAEYILVYSKDGHKNIAKNLLYDLRPEYDEHYSYYLTDDLNVLKLVDVYNNSLKNDDRPIKNKDLSIEYSSNIHFRNFVENNLSHIFRYDKVTGFNAEDFNNHEVTKICRDNRTYYLERKDKIIEQLMFLSNSYGYCNDFSKSYGLRKIRGDYWKGFYLDMGNVSKEGDTVFPNSKKPVRLIEQLIYMCSDKNSKVLDFFAGSGTTGHAVLKLNSEDNGKREFILCTNNEIIDEAPNGIAYDLTSRRIKIIMTGSEYDNVANKKWINKYGPYGDSLDVYEIEEVNDKERVSGKSPFEVIDETNYGLSKFDKLQDKIEWVCRKFSDTRKYIEEDE